MKSAILDGSGCIYLHRDWLIDTGISKNTVKKWLARQQVTTLNLGQSAYIAYASIPKPSRAKLPTEAELLALAADELKGSEVSKAAEKLKKAQNSKFFPHRNYYRETCGFSIDEAYKLGMKRAVWERLIELYKDAHSAHYKGGLKKGALETLHAAYNRVYPGQYTVKQAFLRAIKTVKSDGFDSVIVDKRGIANAHKAKFNEIHHTFVNGIMGIGKAYTANEIRDLMTPMCLEAGLGVPSITWIRTYLVDNKGHNEYTGRYGADATAKTMPYAKMQAALHADKQWQVDGWTLPFYYKNDVNRLDKLTIVAVKDAYSKKIIGYSICRSENRLSILEAFERAISGTGCLPFEIVVDNHAFNKTKEAEYFVTEIQKIGVTWTVTENPQYKSIIERGFKTYGEKFCKKHYGYKGQGVKTREKDGLTSPEMLQQFIKAGQTLSEDEIRAIATECVLAFNETELKSYGRSPNQLYQDSDKPARFELDLYERLRVLTKRTEYLVRRNQIKFTIAGKDYEYQLGADKFAAYNGKKVAIRYDTPDCIYLFDIKTDNPICSLKQKDPIHGAAADQTENDKLLLFKNAGRTKGIIAQSRKKAQDTIDAALALNPDTLEILNRHTTPKDVKKMADTHAELRHELIKNGIDLDKLVPVPKKSEITQPMYLARKRTRKEDSPFTPKDDDLRTVPMGYHEGEE